MCTVATAASLTERKTQTLHFPELYSVLTDMLPASSFPADYRKVIVLTLYKQPETGEKADHSSCHQLQPIITIK